MHTCVCVCVCVSGECVHVLFVCTWESKIHVNNEAIKYGTSVTLG